MKYVFVALLLVAATALHVAVGSILPGDLNLCLPILVLIGMLADAPEALVAGVFAGALYSAIGEGAIGMVLIAVAPALLAWLLYHQLFHKYNPISVVVLAVSTTAAYVVGLYLRDSAQLYRESGAPAFTPYVAVWLANAVATGIVLVVPGYFVVRSDNRFSLIFARNRD